MGINVWKKFRLDRAASAVAGFFSGIWRKFTGFLFKNENVKRFFNVVLPVKMRGVGQFLKKYRYKILIPAAVCVLFAFYLLIFSVINAGNSDYYRPADEDIDYAMRVQPFRTFDHSDKLHIAVRLDWDDGILNLADGKAVSRIKAEVNPINLPDSEIEWTVSDEEYATIDENGRIEAKKAGRVRIYASLVNYGVTAEAKLLVRQPVTGIILPTSTLTLDAGGSARYLNARIFPSDASNKNITWSTKDAKVARVDQNGTVKPVSPGMTEIIAATEDGGFEGRCFVTVVNPSVDVEKISLQNGADMKLTEGESINAVVTVSPSNARNKTLKWSSDNTAVASVGQTGRIRAVSEGSANITAESVNGVKLSFAVDVYAREKEPEIDDEDEFIADGTVTYTPYEMTFPEAVEAHMSQNPPPKVWTRGGNISASEAQTAEYMDPNNYYADAYKYQFLDLSRLSGVTAEQLDDYLSDKGILRGRGEIFINAAKQYNVNEIYLAAHACLETGNGTSQLSNGIEVEGVTVYNMFGIGAYDQSALSSGSLRAYREGWTSVEDAIMGGARYISESYVNSADTQQNTLYKMRWNPERPGHHEYATDIGWAVKQAVSIGAEIEKFGSAELSYDVPVYNGQIPPVIDEVR